MIIPNFPFRRALATVATAVLLASCASAPQAPDGSPAARARLNLLQSNSELASRAPIEIRAAELAVTAAERPEKDRMLSEHLVLIANQKIEMADAWAQSRLYEDQREALSAQSESIRLDARTREAELARRDARYARSEADSARDAAASARNQTQVARSDADSARVAADAAREQTARARNEAAVSRSQTNLALNEADAAREQTARAQNEAAVSRSQTNSALNEADAARNAAENARAQTARAQQDTAAAQAETEALQLQIAALNARPTDRGLVVTLGDVLFETGKAELIGGSLSGLDKLASFLTNYPERTVLIEGHTDNVGSDGSNQLLSQRRASSVQAYLAGQGIAGSRLAASGLGEFVPVSSNDTATGRQQNRRVEVIISNVAEPLR